jgi:hypothetical protein
MLQAQLLAGIAAAPRPYALPALPATVAAAQAQGTDVALAFAIDAARVGAVGEDTQKLFTQALARLIAAALDPAAGDPAFQAAVLRAGDAVVAEFAGLAARAEADARSLRRTIDAIAHPGKLRRQPEGAARDALATLHRLANEEAWGQLAQAPEEGDAGAAWRGDPALQRLVRGQALRLQEPVRRYLALCALRGPAAGSDEAAASGRASARAGELAEQQTVQAFRAIAAQLNARCGTPAYAVAHGLRTPAGFPGAAGQAKDEWDVGLLRREGEAAHVVLLAEVKAAPAAAAADFMRLLRGLQRLALAEADTAYAFASSQGVLQLAGASLRALAPQEGRLPPQAIYCSSAVEERPALLSAAAKGVLLAEPASLRFAQRLAQGEAATPDLLAPVWLELPEAPRLRAVLHQHPTAQAARAAMLHPQDLVRAVEQSLAGPA